MRRKIFYATGFLLMSVALTSCEGLFENCMYCKQVTYVNGTLTNETSETEYCGGSLLTIQATPPVTIGNSTTQWECR